MGEIRNISWNPKPYSSLLDGYQHIAWYFSHYDKTFILHTLLTPQQLKMEKYFFSRCWYRSAKLQGITFQVNISVKNCRIDRFNTVILNTFVDLKLTGDYYQSRMFSWRYHIHLSVSLRQNVRYSSRWNTNVLIDRGARHIVWHSIYVFFLWTYFKYPWEY